MDDAAELAALRELFKARCELAALGYPADDWHDDAIPDALAAIESWKRAVEDVCEINQRIPASAVDFEISPVFIHRAGLTTLATFVRVAIDAAGIMPRMSNRPQDVLLKTNCPRQPNDTLWAGEALLTWLADTIQPCPISADIERIYVTNRLSLDVDFHLMARMDPRNHPPEINGFRPPPLKR